MPARRVVLRVRCPGPLGSCSPVCLRGWLCCVYGVLGHLAPVRRCARSVCCFAFAVSWATWLLFTGLPARCVVVRVRCPGPIGSCSPVCSRGLLCCVCGVLGLLAPVHRCARSVFCFARAVSWATCLPFTGVPARCAMLRVRCPGPSGSCSPVCPLGVLCWVCGVLGHFAHVHRCVRSVCRVACTVSWAPWLLFTGVPARCVVVRVRCPGPLGSCSPVCPLGVLCCVCGVLGHLAPVHRFARLVCCVACAVFWAPWLLFTGVPARCVVLRVRWPWPLGSCSPVRPLGFSCCVYGVLDPLAPVHRCARSVCCVACAVSWAPWLLFPGAPTRCAVLRVRCPWPLGSRSLVCPLGVLCCVCGVLGPLAPVHRCARSVFRVACTVSWTPWLLFTGVPARCVVLRVRLPGPLGSCSPVRPLGVLCCVCGVLGPLAPVHRCARSVCCVACALSLATWLLFSGVPARFVVLRARCPGPLGSCSPVRPLGVLCCVYGFLGPLAPVHRCARSVCCVACAVSWATWLLFTGAPAPCVVLRVRCSGPLGSCSPVCPLGVLCCVCGFLGHLAPVHRCARSPCCVACAVSWAPWLLFTGVPARCVVLRVRCPGPLGSCSPVRPLGLLCCVYGVLGPLAPVHRCARSVCCVACAVSWATWLLFTGAPAPCVVLHVRCSGPLGSCSPVCPLGVLCCTYGVLAPWLLFTGVLARFVVPCVACAGGRCGAHTRPSGRRLFVAGRGWVPSGRALVHPNGGCFVAGRGWVPSGRALVHPDGGCSVAGRGWFAAGRALVHPDGGWCCLAPVLVPWFVACSARSPGLRHPAAVVAWHLSVCLGCGRRRASLACLVAPRSAPRLVRCGRSRCSGRLSRRRGAFPHPGGLRPRLYWVAARGTRRPAENRAHCACRWPLPWLGRSLRVVPVRGPAMGLSLAGPSGVGLGLRALRWLACVDPVTDTSGFPYRPSFDGGLGWCTGAVSCGRRHLPLRVGGRHARVLRMCACARPSWPGRAGRPPGHVLVRLTLSLGRFVFLLCSAPSGLGLPLFWFHGCLPPTAFFFPSLFSLPPAPPLSLSFSGSRPWVSWALAICFSLLPPPRLGFFFSSSFCAPVVSGFLWFPAPGALGLGAACCLFCWPPAPRLSVRCRLLCGSRLAVCCSLVVAALPPPFVSRGFRRFRFASRLFFSFPLRSPPSLSLAFAGFRPRVPWALALCAVSFVGLLRLGSPCARASFAVPP